MESSSEEGKEDSSKEMEEEKIFIEEIIEERKGGLERLHDMLENLLHEKMRNDLLPLHEIVSKLIGIKRKSFCHRNLNKYLCRFVQLFKEEIEWEKELLSTADLDSEIQTVLRKVCFFVFDVERLAADSKSFTDTEECLNQIIFF